MTLVSLVYKMTYKMPNDEKFGLISQIRRSAVSIPSNIAEGKSRRTRNDFRNFLVIASASGSELETQLLICKNLKFGNLEEIEGCESMLLELKKMLSSLISSLS